MSGTDHLARQRAFYSAGAHAHLRARPDDRYAAHIAEALVGQAGIGPEHRVVELGAGFGRFTFPLLGHCRSILAVDLSRRALDDLERERDARGIPPERCAVLCAAADDLSLDDRVDFVVGVFFLHHLPDFPATLARLAPLVSPGGGMGFVEPNRRNPLFLVQIACCPDMGWREEKGLYRIGIDSVAGAMRSASLEAVDTQTFGFFPPPVVNRLPAAVRLERRLERSALLRPLLPFVLTTGRRAA
jgi:SAM-dependent methyltransferase